MYFTHSSLTAHFAVNSKTNRPKSRSKVRSELSGGANYRSKVRADLLAQRIIVRIFARLNTIGVAKVRGNIAEISLGAKFLRKATKSHEFRRSSFALLLHNTVLA